MNLTIVLGPFQPMPPSGMGAVEKVWSEISGELAGMGHDVRLVGKAADAPAKAMPHLQVVGLRGYRASGSLWRDLIADFAYALRVARTIEPSDVIVTNSFWAPVVLALARPRAGAIVVHVARFPKGQMGLYRRAKALHAISSAVGAEIARQTPSMANKVRVLPYPVDLGTYRPPSTPRDYGGPLTVLYVGRLHPEKGLDLLVAAFREVASRTPNVRLRLVGPGDIARGGGGDEWIAALRRSAQGLPVEFPGPIAEPSRLADELQRAHCFCYPSLAEKGEAFGLSVLEAMATGLPVIVSRLGCFEDLMRDGREGLVFDHRAAQPASQLASALTNALSNPRRLREMGDNAAARAREFGLREVAARYVSLFEEARTKNAR